MVHWEGPQVLYTPPAAADIQFYSYPKLIDPDAPARDDWAHRHRYFRHRDRQFLHGRHADNGRQRVLYKVMELLRQ